MHIYFPLLSLPMPRRRLPLRHPPIRRHIHHMDLALGRVQDLVPQAGVVDRERVRLERGGDDGRQVGVVAVIQHLV